MGNRTRGQAHTLEAFMAALLLVAGLIFATQATAVTPLSASTSNQHIENQQRAMANDLLATADERDDLRSAVVFWDVDEREFYNTTQQGYYTDGGPPDHPFGAALDETFRDNRIAFNVYVHYWRESEGEFSSRSRTMVFMGSPSDNAVTASRTVTLYNDTRLSAPGYEDLTVTETENFYMTNVDDGALYNVAEVRIVVWRM